MPRLLFLLFMMPCCAFAQHWNSDTTHLYFPFNQRTLPEGVGRQMDELGRRNVINEHSVAIIIGYADYVGSNAYNDKLSNDRAEAVAGYLKKKFGLTNARILFLQGRGEVSRPGMSDRQGFSRDRRVDLVMDTVLPKPAAPAGVNISTSQAGAAGKVQPPQKIAKLTELKPNETLVLPNLYFYPGRHTLRSNSLPVLEELLGIMQQHPTLRIRIEGHICCITKFPDAEDMDAGDMNLSTNRAHYIRDWLVEHGISVRRLEYQGFARTRPVVPIELTEDDADRNRRVEVRVLSQ